MSPMCLSPRHGRGDQWSLGHQILTTGTDCPAVSYHRKAGGGLNGYDNPVPVSPCARRQPICAPAVLRSLWHSIQQRATAPTNDSTPSGALCVWTLPASGNFGPFATAAISKRLHLPATIRIMLRTSRRAAPVPAGFSRPASHERGRWPRAARPCPMPPRYWGLRCHRARVHCRVETAAQPPP